MEPCGNKECEWHYSKERIDCKGLEKGEVCSKFKPLIEPEAPMSSSSSDGLDFNADYESIETPFDIEAILQACPKLYEQWKRKPFYLDIDKKGNLCIRGIKI
jgi:hypothetical protein